MKRGEIWTLQDHAYASKARPVIVIQSEEITSFDSVILCLLTTYDSSELSNRVYICPSETNQLHEPSYAMTDKIVTVRKTMLGKHIGNLNASDLQKIDIQLKRVLGLK